jgi:hypothetical protein
MALPSPPIWAKRRNLYSVRPDINSITELQVAITAPNLYRKRETTRCNHIIIIILVPLLLENDGLGLLSAHGLWFNG